MAVWEYSDGLYCDCGNNSRTGGFFCVDEWGIDADPIIGHNNIWMCSSCSAKWEGE